MTFTFKLSRRLAIAWLALAAVAVSSCHDRDPIAPAPDQSSITDAAPTFPTPYPVGVTDPMTLSSGCRARVLEKAAWFRPDGAVLIYCAGEYTTPGSGTPPTTGAAIVHVDTTIQYQTWRGWAARFTGGTDQLGLNASVRAAIILDVVQNSGLTSFGMNLDNKSGLALSEMDSILYEWMIPLKQKIGADFRLTVRVQGVPLTDPQLRQVLGKMANAGVMPDYWIVKNEPNIGTNYPVAQIAAVSIMTCNVFKSMGVATRLISAPLSHMPGSYTYGATLKADPALAGCTAEYGYHMYSGKTYPGPTGTNDFAKMASLGPTSMDEYHGAPISDLLVSLQSANLVSWQRDGLVGKTSGCWALYYAPGGMTWYSNKSHAYQRQFQVPIRPGMVRRKVVNDSTRVNAVAFVAGGRYAVVALVNSQGPVTISGLPAGTYHVMTSLGAGTWVSMTTKPDADDARDAGTVTTSADGLLRTTLAGAGYVSVWK
ncbi:MAG: hypothetical protein ABI679_11605 [Gemmatimonadota bacterium]